MILVSSCSSVDFLVLFGLIMLSMLLGVIVIDMFVRIVVVLCVSCSLCVIRVLVID